MNLKKRLRYATLASMACAGAIFGANPAFAQISFTTTGRNIEYRQTGNGNSTVADSFFYSIDLQSVSNGDFATASFTPSGMSAISLSPDSPSRFHFQTFSFATQAAMDLAFPTGTYSATATGGAFGPQTTSFSYSGDRYSSAQPYFTGSDFTSLQGADAHSAITLHFSPFASDPTVTDQFRFLSVYDLTANTNLFSSSFLPTTTNSVTIGANVLNSGDSFLVELIDSNRVAVPATNSVFDTILLFDRRTFILFQTSASVVPEAGFGQVGSALAVCALGFGLFARRKRSAA